MPLQLLVQRRYKCEVCNKDFKRVEHLNIHNNAVHLGVKYPCDKCEYKATVPGILRTHIRSKHDGIKVPCTQCDYKAFDRSSLLKHMKQVHLGLKPHACLICEFKAFTTGNLKQHVNRYHDQTDNVHQCSECQYKTGIKIDYESHKRRHRKVMISCDLCDFKSKTTDRLKDHKRCVHRKEKIKCNQCEFSCLSKSNLYHHKQSVHLGRTYQCDKCDHVALNKNLLISHMGKVHRMKQEFSCKICTKVFKWKETLRRHMDSSHNEEGKTSFKCNICQKVFAHHATLFVHTKSQHNEEKASCDQCDKKFQNSSSLSCHKKRIHEGKTFPCDACPYKLSTGQSLEKHTKRKHKNKSAIPEGQTCECKLCPYKTDTQEKLDKHASSHMPKERHVCKLCSKSLSSFKGLARHMNNHSKTATAYHKCQICPYSSPNKRGFEKHLKDTHGLSNMHICPICKKSLTSQKNLAVHIKFHSRKRTSHHRCTKCFFHSASQLLLKRHVWEVHNIKKTISCLKCDVKLELIKDFHSHMKAIHPKKLKVARKKETSQSLQTCSICEYSSYLKKDVNSHKKSHKNYVKNAVKPDDVPHPCDKCTKSFTTRKLLTQHLKLHGDFICTKCLKTFSLKSQLLSLKHSCNNIQDTNCSLCSKSFRFKGEMKRHVRAFHLKERLFKCKECPKAYTDPTPLKHHTNSTHGDGSTFSTCSRCKKTFTTKRRFLEHTQKFH